MKVGTSMEKDPLIVSRLAFEKEDENWQFRTFLKMGRGGSRGRINSLAEQFGRQAEAQMECTACGACCRDICVPLSSEEQIILAKRAGLAPAEFAERHMTTSDHAEPAIQAKPCHFLDGTRCSVYEDRPNACRGYPYIGGDIATRMIGILERVGTCPIMFEMVEQLKTALRFRRFR
jgi:hypothetical protein